MYSNSLNKINDNLYKYNEHIIKANQNQYTSDIDILGILFIALLLQINILHFGYCVELIGWDFKHF